ncbi:uncharacterized protein [Triticum aestivum]|uniref:uncharacterized protein isoform X1 n=1 Tax=Triticum aestivum TaxID=4565 RepID=UPI001D01C109|nr:uncharacterized protein LOC123085840 isoform X1 [Triticum aestivum]XP_044363481.1 uncharacterized protein LOC123085840 isoform X1 [Triticum aestivum]
MIVPRAPCSRSGLNLPYQGSFVEAAATLVLFLIFRSLCSGRKGKAKPVSGTLLFGTCHPLSSAPVRICPVRRVSQCVSVLCFTRACVCFGSGASPWMLKTMRSTYLFFMKFSQVSNMRAKRAGPR